MYYFLFYKNNLSKGTDIGETQGLMSAGAHRSAALVPLLTQERSSGSFFDTRALRMRSSYLPHSLKRSGRTVRKRRDRD